MHNKKVALTAQVLISCMMAFMMTGFFATLHLGLTDEMLREWRGSFVIAWPVAFVLSLISSAIAFRLALRIVGRLAP